MLECVAFLMYTSLGVEQIPFDTALVYHMHAVEPKRFMRKVGNTNDTMVVCITEKYIDTIVNRRDVWKR